MNDLASKWSEHAEALLQWSANVAEKAGNFASEQTPLLVQEYLQWMFVEKVISAASCFAVWLMMVASAFALCKFVSQIHRQAMEEYAKQLDAFKALEDKGKVFAREPDAVDEMNYKMPKIMAVAVCCVIGMIPLSRAVSTATDAVKVKIAPRVVIVEKIADLAKVVKR